MSYEQAVILHKVLTELHTGMLFLASLSAVATFFTWRRSVWKDMARTFDAIFIGSAICGVVFLLLSGVSGFLAWPWDRLWRTPVAYGKVTYAMIALTLWIILILARLRQGIAIWESRSESVPILICSLLALAALLMAGSAGGHLGHGASLLDPFFAGINPYAPLVLAPWLSAGIMTSGVYFIVSDFFEKEEKMRKARYAILLGLFIVSAGLTRLLWREEPVIAAQPSRKEHIEHGTKQSDDSFKQETGKTRHEHITDHEGKTKKTGLRPADGASVKIISPKQGEAFKGDEIPIHFNLVKGKSGHHIHAYVDGEPMGMFETEKGTLTGIPPGHHVLEVRVVAKDHVTELDATDKVTFATK